MRTVHILSAHLAKVAGEKADDIVADMERIAERWPQTRDAYLEAAHELRQAITLRDTPVEEMVRQSRADVERLVRRSA